MNLNEINLEDLQFDKIGNWPREIQYITLGVVFVISLIGSIFFLCGDDYDRYQRLVQTERKLKVDFEKRQDQYANNEAFNEQLKKILKQTEDLISKLPYSSQIPEMIEKISEQALFANVDTKQIRPQEVENKGFYSELPYQLVVQGNYHQLGKFVEGLSNSERIITLHDFKINWPRFASGEQITIGEADSKLTMQILIKSYWQVADEKTGVAK